MINGLARSNARQDSVFLGLAIVGNDHPNGTANRLRGCIPKHPFGRVIPRSDDAIQILADDGVVR
jgi:hypothetical protein